MSARGVMVKEDMAAWVKVHRRDPAVRQWLVDHPPPSGWRGTPLQWAYTEMPNPDSVVGQLLMYLGL